jgi:hypothetical protein
VTVFEVGDPEHPIHRWSAHSPVALLCPARTNLPRPVPAIVTAVFFSTLILASMWLALGQAPTILMTSSCHGASCSARAAAKAARPHQPWLWKALTALGSPTAHWPSTMPGGTYEERIRIRTSERFLSSLTHFRPTRLRHATTPIWQVQTRSHPAPCVLDALRPADWSRGCRGCRSGRWSSTRSRPQDP